MMEEKKVYAKLEKRLLESERKERKTKFIRNFFITILCILFLILGMFLGFLLNTPVSRSASGKLNEIKEYLKNNWLYSNDYEDLDTLLDDKAYYGMTDFINDPYTSYMSKEEVESFASSINMNYVGIGVSYSNIDGISTVLKVFKNSPAEKAGIEAGDIIVAVDGTKIFNFDNDQIKNLITGLEGTKVNLTINRAGKELNLDVIRGQISSTVYAYQKDDFVVLEINSFGETTANECISYLDDYLEYKKIIIDLRDDTGGYQTAVQEVAGLFLGKDKVVMDQIYNTGEKMTFKTIVPKYYDNFEKIVLLVNQNTASAAEVLVMCLKELHDNVTVVGETTFGKGVVQSTYFLEGGDSAIKMTTSKWLSPSGIWINGEGIKPDYEVFLDDVFYFEKEAMKEDEIFKIDNVSRCIAYSQLALKYLEYDIKRTDGYFDESLNLAIIKFQNDYNIPLTGNLDFETYQAIISQVIRTINFNEEKDAQFLKALSIIKE